MSKPDKTLFDSLHKDYYAMVFQMCMGFVRGDKDLAKDLCQEVFINTWNALNRFKADSSYKTWIYRITVNTCLKYFRDKKDKNNIAYDQIEHQLTEEDETQTNTNEKRLYNAISKLNEVDRLIIMMTLEELKYEEIAKIIGISAVNLRVKIHRIKLNLKKILENE